MSIIVGILGVLLAIAIGYFAVVFILGLGLLVLELGGIVLLVSIIPALVSIFVSFITMRILLPSKKSDIDTLDKKLCQLAKLEIEHEPKLKVKIKMDEDSVKKALNYSTESKINIASIVSFLLGVSAGIALTQYLYSMGILANFGKLAAESDLSLNLSPAVVYIIDVVMVIIVSSTVVYFNIPYIRYTLKFETEINRKLSKQIRNLNKTIAEMKNLAQKIEQVRGKLYIFPSEIDIFTFIRRQIYTKKCDILKDSTVVEQIFESYYSYLENYLKNAQDILSKIKIAEELIYEAKKERGIFASLFFPDRRISKISNKLKSDVLSYMIKSENWNGCKAYLDEIISELNEILGNKQGGYYNKDEQKAFNRQKTHKEDRDGFEKDSQEPETDLQKACRILNVPENADFEQVKRAYRILAGMWHPDSGLVKDDKKMKEINWAYEVLKKYKGS